MDGERVNIDLSGNPKQAEFVTNTSKFSCYSGGFGSGKTFAGCLKGLLLSQYPGNRGLIGRLTYPELRTTTRKTFFEICPPEWYDPKGGGQWKPSENQLKFINGSEILFVHLDTVSEKELLSLNLGWFFIDQAEEISEKIFDVLVSRLRLNKVPNRYGFLACNPERSSWIYDTFQKPVDDGAPKKDYYIINSSTTDNPFNPADYVETMKGRYPETLIRKYIEGSWEAVEGRIYLEFDTKTHVVKPFDVPKSWEIIVGLDHGMVNPTAALVAALDYDGNVYIIDEYYQPGIVSDHAKAIHEMTRGLNVSFWVIDPSTEAKTREKNGMPWSILQEYEDYGLFFTPGNNSKLGGINRVSEFLKVDDKRINPRTAHRGSPKLFIFQNCVNVINEFQGYEWKKLRGLGNKNEREVPSDYKDHAMDALRYIIMSRFANPERNPMGDMLVPGFQRGNQNIMAQASPVQRDNDDESLGNLSDSPLSTDTYD